MRFSLDVRRARKGDCLLLHYGTEERSVAGADRRRTEQRLQAASETTAREDQGSAGPRRRRRRCRSI